MNIYNNPMYKSVCFLNCAPIQDSKRVESARAVLNHRMKEHLDKKREGQAVAFFLGGDLPEPDYPLCGRFPGPDAIPGLMPTFAFLNYYDLVASLFAEIKILFERNDHKSLKNGTDALEWFLKAGAACGFQYF